MTDQEPSLKKPVIEDLMDDIFESRKKEIARNIRPQNKRPYLYLSDIHFCNRHNYYSMVEGDKRRPINDYVQLLFESGNIWERETIRELMLLGFDVMAGQQSVEVKYGGKLVDERGKIIGKGRIDGKIKYKKQIIPFEIKSLGENVYRKIESVEDLFKYEFTEKYVRQFLMYLYGDAIEAGIFIINDRSGHWKIMVIYLGNFLDYCEKVLRNMEAAWEAKIAEKEPDRIPYNHRLCGNCQFNAVCVPETIIEGGETLEDPELEAKISRHEEIHELKKEYDDIHDDLKALFKAKPQTTIGKFIVTPKKTTKLGGYDYKQLPKETLDKIAKPPIDSWGFKVDDITKSPAN